MTCNLHGWPMSNETQTSTESIERADAGQVPNRFQGSPANSEAIDPKLINETKNQIRNLVQEIRDLASSECSREEFYQGFLTRTIGALASVGGAIWLRNSEGHLQLEYHANLGQSGLKEKQQQAQHGRLLEQLMESGQPTLVPPHSGNADDEAEAISNPTEHLLVIGTLTTENEVDGLVEIFQRPGGGPTTQRGYLRFLVQMCEIASTFLKNQRLKDFGQRQETWHRLEKFVHQIHNGLDTKQTVYTLANEGRQFAECDRVSVALMKGSRCKIESVSGLDAIERRAEQVKLLGKLATTVVRADMSLWYNGDDTQLPPQIEKRLQEYVDCSHSKMIAILPLHESQVEREDPTETRRRRRKPKLIGAIIFEQLGDDRIGSSMKTRAEVVQSHGSDALTNSLTHSNVVMMPLLKAIGAVPGVKAASRIPKWALAIAVLVAIGWAMTIIPYDFSLAANGKLVPETRYEIFAPSNGILKEIYIPEDPNAVVEKDAVLAEMTNNDLLVDIETLQGQLKTEIEQQKKLERARNQKLERIEQLELEGEIGKSKQAQISIRRKLQLKQYQLSKLTLRAPQRGQIVNWQLRQNLIRRPVQQGQNLMTVVDPETSWQLELELPEKRVEHLMQQSRSSDQAVRVTFTLASHPGSTFEGEIVEMDRKLDVYSEEGNSVLVRVAFDKETIPTELLKSGTRVTAKIHCGERSVGYVLFHELIETVQAKVMFWF